MDPNTYKKKYGAKDKQKLMPPSYMCKRGGIATGDYDASLDDLEEVEPKPFDS